MRKLSLKMYVWDNVLVDYTSGMVCVLAASKTQALSVLKRTDEFVWKECKNQEPGVYKDPAAVYVWGGG